MRPTNSHVQQESAPLLPRSAADDSVQNVLNPSSGAVEAIRVTKLSWNQYLGVHSYQRYGLATCCILSSAGLGFPTAISFLDICVSMPPALQSVVTLNLCLTILTCVGASSTSLLACHFLTITDKTVTEGVAPFSGPVVGELAAPPSIAAPPPRMG